MNSKRSYNRYRDPFAVDPLPKAHYYPSPEKHLSRSQKATSIKTNCTQDEKLELNNQEKELNPVDEEFLNGANSYQTRRVGPLDDNDDDDDNFDESWPCSERPSATSLPDVEDSTTDLDKYLQLCREDGKLSERIRMPGSYTSGPISVHTKITDKPVKSRIPVRESSKNRKELDEDDVTSDQEGSVLQRYVNRFRNSAPMSRDERDKMAATTSQDFWWLSNGQPQYPSKQTADKKKPNNDQSSQSSALTKDNLEKYRQLNNDTDNKHFNKRIPQSPNDKRTIELQERAERLLEKSSSTVLSTEPAVSTEGLGSNTSDMSSLDEYSHKPSFAQYLEPEKPAKFHSMISPSLPGQRPPSENDPLYQWRLRRKMELAQQSAPQQTPQFDFLGKTDQQKKIDSKLEEFKQRLAGRAPSKSQVQFTPAPKVEQATVTQSRVNNESWRPQIASPSLYPNKSSTDPHSDVDPHLHLMCDLLPCPHSGQYVQPGTSNMSEHGKQSKGDNSVNNVNTQSKEGNYVSPREYKQYLEAEKPDVDKVPDKQTERDRNVDIDANVRTKPVRSIEEIEKMVQDIGKDEVDNEKSESKDFNKDMSDRKTTDGKSNDKSGSNSARSDKSVKSNTDDNVNRVSNTQNLKPDSKDGSKQPKESSILPKHSSSPKNGRKGVSDTIGQVVKEHLFRTSTSTVLSSVDSLPPSVSTERLPWKHKTSSHDQDRNQPLDDDETYDSDGAFDDDNLLQMLRKQRSMFEQQLQQIDEMLLKIDDN